MDGPIILVTGASRGLGSATAAALARLGAGVVMAARSADALQERAQRIAEAGGVALAVPADLGREADCRALVQRALDRFGRLDGLINNAGTIEPIGPLVEAPFDQWDQSWAINVLAPLRLMLLALPHLRPVNGRILNITSSAAGEAIAGWGAYTTAKLAINNLTAILAREEPEVTALALRPGILDTAMQATIRAKGKARMAERNYAWLVKLFENGRLVAPELPARAAACLALYAPREWSGENLAWEEPRVQQLVEAHWPAQQG